ncbi:MAG: Cof-type HAD-IIB family hydrolase [Deltaproteobacteria bacterium]|nr:Cof-type HAD-IIB family hydrolase [Deltaproteobacteria bacterium]
MVKKEARVMREDGTGKGLFITDFDGTLLRTDGTIALRDLKALEAMTRSGIKTAVATGRSLFSFNCSPGADLPVDYVIFTTGAGVITQPAGDLVYKINLPPDVVARVLAFFRKTDFDFMLHHPVPDNHRFGYRRFSLNNRDFESRIELYRAFGEPLNSSNENGFGEAAQFLAVVPEHKSGQALTSVRKALPALSVVQTTSPLDHLSTWIEVFHADVSKSKTAAWLAGELNVAPENTMAVGNDFNDGDLLAWAANSFVVNNAPGALKGRYQTVASNNDGGVAEAVDRWLNK